MFEGLFRPTHLIVILVIVMLFFGPGKLPQLGSALGKTIRDFKKAVNEAGEPEKAPGEVAPARALPPKSVEGTTPDTGAVPS
jgi:sec-independent protein translocase protein TatA